MAPRSTLARRLLRALDTLGRVLDLLEVKDRWRPFWTLVAAVAMGVASAWQGWFGEIPWPGQFMLGAIFLFLGIYILVGVGKGVRSIRQLPVQVDEVIAIIRPYQVAGREVPPDAQVYLAPFGIVNRGPRNLILDFKLEVARSEGAPAVLGETVMTRALCESLGVDTQPVTVEASKAVRVETYLHPTVLQRLVDGVPLSINRDGTHALILKDRISGLTYRHTDIYVSVEALKHVEAGARGTGPRERGKAMNSLPPGEEFMPVTDETRDEALQALSEGYQATISILNSPLLARRGRLSGLTECEARLLSAVELAMLVESDVNALLTEILAYNDTWRAWTFAGQLVPVMVTGGDQLREVLGVEFREDVSAYLGHSRWDTLLEEAYEALVAAHERTVGSFPGTGSLSARYSADPQMRSAAIDAVNADQASQCATELRAALTKTLKPIAEVTAKIQQSPER